MTFSYGKPNKITQENQKLFIKIYIQITQNKFIILYFWKLKKLTFCTPQSISAIKKNILKAYTQNKNQKIIHAFEIRDFN